jgi:CheY-like chemotaxis protein
VSRGQLVKLGCHVNIASNGQLALEHFKATPTPKYDIILLDLEMPVLGTNVGVILLSIDNFT